MQSIGMHTARLLTVSQHALPGGVPGQGGVPAQGVPAQVFSPCEQNDRQVQKYYLAPNLFAGGNQLDSD